MISLEQVYLLEQKVESAVAKIQQLQAENDALRNKCAELTNALTAKSEQLSSFEQDQSQIESGIRKALDRLNSIENSVLKAAGQALQTQAAAQIHTNAAVTKAPEPQIQQAVVVNKVVEAQKPAVTQTQQFAPQVQTQVQQEVTNEAQEEAQPNFDLMQQVLDYSQNSDTSADIIDETIQDDFSDNADESMEEEQNPGFDIF